MLESKEALKIAKEFYERSKEATEDEREDELFWSDFEAKRISEKFGVPIYKRAAEVMVGLSKAGVSDSVAEQYGLNYTMILCYERETIEKIISGGTPADDAVEEYFYYLTA